MSTKLLECALFGAAIALLLLVAGQQTTLAWTASVAAGGAFLGLLCGLAARWWSSAR